MKHFTPIILILFLAVSISGHGQEDTNKPVYRIDTLATYFDMLSETVKPLNDKVEFGVSGVSVREFLRAIGSSHDLNIVIDEDIDGIVYNNFSDVLVKEVLIYIANEYHLSVNFIGSIITFKPMEEVVPPHPAFIPSYKINYNPRNEWLSLEAKGDTLSVIAKTITELSGVNIVLLPEIQNKIVNCFIKDRPLEEVLEMFSMANGLSLNKINSKYYTFSKPKEELRPNRKTDQNLDIDNGISTIQVDFSDSLLLNIKAINKPLKEILSEVSLFANYNYVLYDEPEGNASVIVNNVTFNQFLDFLLSGTKLTYRKELGMYLIGDRTDESFRATEVIKLDYRTVEKITDFIPNELKNGVDIKVFPELNSLIVSGSSPAIKELRNFIIQIDQIVPVVKIEVMIIDFKKSHDTKIGVDMYLGVGTPPSKSSGSLTGDNGGGATLNSNTVNSLIKSFNGFGWFNLGAVTSEFYMSIQAMEANGNLKVRSTPMMATLNGHEASMTIGNTEYYQEITNNLVGNQNPISQTSQVYKSIQADLNLTILPFVSSDGHVTLNIQVSQSDFTGRIAETAPPGQISRNFSSLIRVKDGEMIILGGLEENKKSSNSQGLPWVSRIPVLKWIFGKQSKTTSDSKLHIFIKPTIIY
jgi:type IV pilus assembly protein PilQ